MRYFLEQPFLSRLNFIKETDIVSLDIETTGLDSKKDKIVSIGLVQISDLGIKLNSCWHQIIKTNIDLPEKSVLIHNITDDETAQNSVEKTSFSKPNSLAKMMAKTNAPMSIVTEYALAIITTPEPALPSILTRCSIK